MKTIISERLKILRGPHNQSEFARIIGVKQTSYSGWETSGKDPSANAIRLIAQECNVSADYILGLIDEQRPLRSPTRVHLDDSNVSSGDTLEERVTRIERILEKMKKQYTSEKKAKYDK